METFRAETDMRDRRITNRSGVESVNQPAVGVLINYVGKTIIGFCLMPMSVSHCRCGYLKGGGPEPIEV